MNIVRSKVDCVGTIIFWWIFFSRFLSLVPMALLRDSTKYFDSYMQKSMFSQLAVKKCLRLRVWFNASVKCQLFTCLNVYTWYIIYLKASPKATREFFFFEDKRFGSCFSYLRFVTYVNSLLDVFLSFNLFYYNANSIRNRNTLFVSVFYLLYANDYKLSLLAVSLTYIFLLIM